MSTTELLPPSIETTAVAPRSALQQTMSSALQAQVEAEIVARYKLAMLRPRDVDKFFGALMKDCRRPSFARVARYAKPQGRQKNQQTGKWEEKTVDGPSIRFVEAALRHWGNVMPTVVAISDDDRSRTVRVTVTDLEANLSYSQDVIFDKTVERRDGKGRRVFGQRTNSYGDPVFIVEATEDEVRMLQARLVSMALRQCGLRLLPGDIVDEAQALILQVRQDKDAQDPDAMRKAIVADYANLGVPAEELREYLGHDLDQTTPAEGQALYDLANGIREGAVRWAEVLRERREERAPAEPAKTAKGALGLRDKEQS